MVCSHYHQVVSEPRSHIITTKQGVQYRKTQTDLKPYKPQEDTGENELLAQNNHKWTVKSVKYKQSYDNLAHSRARRDIKPPEKLDL